MQSATSAVSRSWTCSRLAKPWSTRAIHCGRPVTERLKDCITVTVKSPLKFQASSPILCIRS